LYNKSETTKTQHKNTKKKKNAVRFSEWATRFSLLHGIQIGSAPLPYLFYGYRNSIVVDKAAEV
jgi:hypothetical protein